jgi:hypothetical protein
MRQNDLVGVLPTADQLAAVQQSLHYARHVLLMDVEDSAKLPPVGRGRAVAGAAGWRAHIGRATVVVGTDAQLAELLHDLRSAVVAVVCGEAGAAAERVAALGATHEAHIVHLGAEPLRIIVSDAGQVSVQAWDGEWRSLVTVVTAAPEAARKKRRAAAEQLPPPPSEVVLPADSVPSPTEAQPTTALSGDLGALSGSPVVAPTPTDETAPEGETAQPAQEQ